MAKSIKLNDNTYLDSTGIVHNKTKLSDILTYSTSEQKIGTWINGNPIYRKVIEVGNMPNNTTKNVAHGIDGLDAVLSIQPKWKDTGDGVWYCANRIDNSTTKIVFTVNATNVKIEGIGTNWSTRTSNGTVTLIYTKSTD